MDKILILLIKFRYKFNIKNNNMDAKIQKVNNVDLEEDAINEIR